MKSKDLIPFFYFYFLYLMVDFVDWMYFILASWTLKLWLFTDHFFKKRLLNHTFYASFSIINKDWSPDYPLIEMKLNSLNHVHFSNPQWTVSLKWKTQIVCRSLRRIWIPPKSKCPESLPSHKLEQLILNIHMFYTSFFN